jgi:putative peptidoglycan lipid II flippase
MFPFNKLSGLYKSSAVVSAWTLLSRLMGFIRDILFASILGTGPIADAFLVAFRVPNLFRRFFADGAFSAAFIPILSKEYEKYGIQGGILFTSKIASFLLVFIWP